MTTSAGYPLPPPPAAPQAPKKSHAWLWATLVVVVVFGLIVAGAIAKNNEDNSGLGNDTTTDSGIDQGIATNDASGDVSVGDCETDFGFITCDVTIVNSSDGRSDYYIEATVEDPSGAKVGTANTYVAGWRAAKQQRMNSRARSQERERISRFGSPRFNGPLRSPLKTAGDSDLAALLIGCEEDRVLRAVLVGMLREAEA